MPRVSIALLFALAVAPCRAHGETAVVDLSLLVASDYPCTWPQAWPLFQLNHHREIGPLSPYHIDILSLDPNTGTQMDTPPHSIPPPGSGLPYEGPAGALFTEKIPAWQFCGEACVVDIRELLGKAPLGVSPLVEKKHIELWEKTHRSLRFGDVLLLRSDYSDRYYKPFPEGRQFLADCLEKKKPGYPDPHPSCLEYVASKGVMHMGTDSPSMGTLPTLMNEAHVAGLKHGGIFTEGATGLSALPPTGAFYCMMGPKHAGGAYGEARAFAIVEQPLAGRLIASARARRALDLSVELRGDLPVWWPGTGVGNYRQPYYRVNFSYAASIDYHHNTHILDSHTGTHLVPPSYALPRAGFDNARYSDEVRRWLADYEKRFGERGTSDATVEKVPVAQTCGPARVVDVRHLVGTTDKASWPASPRITVDVLKAAEAKDGDFAPGDVVIFASGHTDRHFRPFPEGKTCLEDPLSGDSEGWPAPGPEAIHYLAKRGVRCVATDGPSIGGVDPRLALMTYWALGSRDMVAVEFLTRAVDIPQNAYFLFAAIKIRGAHGSPGRAICLY